jgi:hypothetical protein
MGRPSTYGSSGRRISTGAISASACEFVFEEVVSEAIVLERGLKGEGEEGGGVAGDVGEGRENAGCEGVLPDEVSEAYE